MQIPSGVFIHNPPHEEIGVLELGVAVSGGKSIATRQFNTPVSYTHLRAHETTE